MKRSSRTVAIILAIVLVISCTNMLIPVCALAEFVLPKALTRVEDEAFMNDSRLTGLVELPSSIESVGAHAFAGSGVYAVDFPNSVKMISAGAVQGEQLNYVIVRNSSAEITENAFEGVNYIFAPEGSTVKAYTYATGTHFVDLDHLVLKDGFYYEVTDSAALLCARDATKVAGRLIVPDEINGVQVEEIYPNAFKGCEALTELELPNDSIADYGALAHLGNTRITYRGTVPVIHSVSASVSGSIDAGKSVLWSVRATSDSDSLMYAFDLNRNGEIVASRDFGTSNFYSAVLNEPGYYSLTVVCKDSAGLVSTSESEVIRVKNMPLSITSVEAEDQLYIEGDELSWHVTTADGTMPILYNYVLYADGTVVDRQDMASENTYSYSASARMEYVLEVSCIDADETLCVLKSDPVQVYASDEIHPAAPELVFTGGNAPFAEDEESAPDYIAGRIQLNWNEVTYANGYTLELSRKENGEWASVLSEDLIINPSYSLSASLFAGLTEKSMYRLELTSMGVQTGRTSTRYFSVIPSEIDETISIDGLTSTVWNQSSRHAGSKEFTIDSDLAWEASSDAEWVTWSSDGDVLTLNMAERLDTNGVRIAAVTVKNGVNSAVITVRQSYNDFAPVLLAPQFSSSIDNPTRMPAGDFRIGWEKYKHNFVRLRVYEEKSNTLAFEQLDRYYLKLTESLTGYEFKENTLYRFELAGVYSADYAKYEDEDDILKSQWYAYMTGEHEITLNNRKNLVINIVDEAYFQVFATNFYTYATDADWLTVKASATTSYDEEAYVMAAANTTGAQRTGHVTFTCGSATAVLTVNQSYIAPHIECDYTLSTNASKPTAVPYGSLPVVIYSVAGGWGTYANGVHTTINEWDHTDDVCISVSDVDVPVDDYDNGAVFWIRTAIGNASNTYYFKTDDSQSFYWISLNGRSYQWERHVPSHAFETTATLRTNGSWTASSNSSWLTVSPTSGSKVTTTSGKQITIGTAKNTTGSERKGVVTFSCNGTRFYLYVTQGASSYVKIYDYDYYVSSGSGSGYTKIEYDPNTFYKHMDGSKDSLKLYAFSNDGFSARCNSDWLTFSGGDSVMSSTSSSKLVTVNLAENATGASRTGTVSFTAGDTEVVVSITQETKMSDPELVILNSGYTVGVDGESGLLLYEDVEVQWKPVKDAVYYTVEYDWGRVYRFRVDENGSAVYHHTIPKEKLKISSENDVSIAVAAYNAYGHMVDTSIYVYVVSGSTILIDGIPEAEWMAVDDRGQSKQLAITSTGNWTASASPWIQLSNTGGTSGDTITATVLANSGAAREGQIVFSAGDAQLTMVVQQYAAFKDVAYLNTPQYSMDGGTPTLIDSNTASINCNWDAEPQVDYYRLALSEVGGSKIAEIKLSEGENSYTFSDMKLTPGSIYSLYFERWAVGRYRDGVWYYFQAAVDDAWILVDGQTSNYSDLEADEDYEYFDISCNGMWAAKSDKSWIMVYNESISQEDLDEWGETSDDYRCYAGHSGDDLCISVLANTSGTARTGNVTIVSSGATYTIPVTQYQSYSVAELTSPILATKKADSTTLPFGSVTLHWSEGSGVTGNYQVIVYESDTQSYGYDLVAYNSKKTTETSCTIPVSNLKEGYYYEVYLKTEVTSGSYQRKSYYFHMGRENELTLSAQLRSSSVSIGGYIAIDATASGGAGNYIYTYILMKNGVEVTRSSAQRGIDYYTFAISEAGTYQVAVYVQDGDGTVASATTGTVAVGGATNTPAPTVTASPTITPVPTSTATSTPGANPTSSPTVSPAPIAINAPVIDGDMGYISTNGSVHFEWNSVANAVGYAVWRSVSSESDYRQIGKIDDSAVCWWTDRDLEDGVRYFYKVQALASSGTASAFSNTFAVTAVNTDKPLGGETVTINGSFTKESYWAEIDGHALQLTGSVSCTGTSINRITINVQGMTDLKYERLMTQTFTDGPSVVDLGNCEAFRIDTTVYPFNEPGTYTLQLWASTTDGISASSPLATTTLKVVRFNAKLCSESGSTNKTIVLGDKWIVNGEVSVEGSNLGRVTVNAYATLNSNMTDDFTAQSTSSVELKNWAEYTIDTTKEPFNKEGTYTLHVWAKDVNGVGGSHSLAQMTVNVVEKSEISSDYSSIHAMVEGMNMTKTVRSVRNGKIRFVSQFPTEACFVTAYWKDANYDLTSVAAKWCSRSVFSMAMSYLGVDCTPVAMSSLTGTYGISTANGYDAVLKKLGNVELVNGDWETLWSNYEENGYSPIYIHYDYPGSMHALLIVGRDQTNMNMYYAVNPAGWTNATAYKGGYTHDHVIPIIIEDGKIGKSIGSPLVTKYDGGIIDEIYQWKLK